jgi:hypothetical protein
MLKIQIEIMAKFLAYLKTIYQLRKFRVRIVGLRIVRKEAITVYEYFKVLSQHMSGGN